MRNGSVRFLGGLLALLAVGAPRTAAPSELPKLRPTHDVAVVYRVVGTPAGGGAAQAHSIRMVWGDGGDALRVAIDAQPMVALIDFRRQRMALVIVPSRVVVEAPLDPRLVPGFALPAGASALRAGEETVAGYRCTVWTLTGPQGAGEACVTQDGLVLRAEGSAAREGSGRLEATAVSYAPQPASLFVPPPGLRRMDLPPTRR